MRILLPPSETKTMPAGGAHDPDSLAHPGLAGHRARIMDALIATSGEPRVCEALGVPEGLAESVRANTLLREAPTGPALEVYTGVLYDALGAPTWDKATKARADLSVLIFSALFGVLTPGDCIPAYRLSGTASLPGIGRVASSWRTPLSAVLEPDDLLIDCRSGTYTSMWKPAGLVGVRVLTEVGGVRKIVSHRAKHARGLVARALLSTPAPATIDEAVDVARSYVATHTVRTAAGAAIHIAVERSATSIDIVTS